MKIRKFSFFDLKALGQPTDFGHMSSYLDESDSDDGKEPKVVDQATKDEAKVDDGQLGDGAGGQGRLPHDVPLRGVAAGRQRHQRRRAPRRRVDAQHALGVARGGVQRAVRLQPRDEQGAGVARGGCF